jgi:ABC-type lipoprotein export system ATPase subunit
MLIDAAPVERRTQYGPPLQEGFNNFNVTLENVQKALGSSYFKGRFLTAVGKTEWDQIRWNDASIAEKRNVIHNADIVFTAAPTATAFEIAHTALVDANVNSRLLDCSDAHFLSTSDAKDRIRNCFTWIKADTTFAGLQHAIREYSNRVYVGDVPEKMFKVRSNPTKYIREVRTRKRADSDLQESWFDFSIPLNKDLVAIIGNKGSGKSAFADTVGLLGDTKQSEHFSFLNQNKFRDPRENKAAHFESTLVWESDISASKSLDYDPEPEAVETVRYLPQNYVETLCNDIVEHEDSDFYRELKQIIFGHVTLSERLGHDSLDDLLTYLTAETLTRIRMLADSVHTINERIHQHELRGAGAFRAQMEAQLKIRRQELEAHDKSAPEAYPEPTQSQAVKKMAAKIHERIANRKEALREVTDQLVVLDKQRADAARRTALLDKAIAKLDNFDLEYQRFKRAISSDLRELSIDPPLGFEDVVQLNLNRARLSILRDQYSSEVARIDEKLDPSTEGSIGASKVGIEGEIVALHNTLDEPNRKYVAYQNAHEVWSKKREAILGNGEAKNSIAWLQCRLEELDAIPAQLQELRGQRETYSREIYKEIEKLSDSYGRLYRPIQAFVEHQKISSDAIPLSFDVSIAEEGFATSFLEKINRQVRGTFMGVEDSNILIRKKLQAVDFNNEQSVIAFINEMHSCLHSDIRSGQSHASVQVGDQMRKNETPVSMYDYLFSLSFLKPRYTLRYGGREIYQLSPGERGLLLLVFYLLIDKDEVPLIIDQPEENLDNQTIYEVLVRCLNDAKRRRQVIVVTHNPNLAVVCDAEQVIYAQRDVAVNSVTYEAGSIENPTINKHIIDVLEGTRPAFKNRDSKYFA